MKEKIKEICFENFKNNWKSFLKVLIILGIILVVSLIMNGLNEWKVVLWMFGVLFLWTLVFFIITFFIAPILVVIKDYFVKKNTFEYNWIDKARDFNFEKNTEYYRELTEIESPLLINKIHGRFATKNVVVAELLSMERRRIIRFEGDKIKVLNRNKLSHCERAFLRFVIDGKVKISNPKEYMTLLSARARADLDENERWFRYEKVSNKKKIINLLIAAILSVILFAFARLFTIRMDLPIWKTILFVSLYVLGVFMSVLFYPPVLVETKEFKDLKNKIAGLERFLKEYSMLEERTAKEIELWEEYLIYSVMFGQNQKIVEEYEKYIEIN